MLYYDTESVGLVGPCVLIQYGEEEGDISVHQVWRTQSRETLQLIERLMDRGTVGFNLTHDQFTLQRCYTVLRRLSPGAVPTAAGWLAEERAARFGPCLRPRKALDLWLIAKRGPAQSMMERKPIFIRSVPEVLAGPLAEELKARVQLDEIYFRRRKKDGYTWQVVPNEDKPGFPDVVLRWGAATGLGALCHYFGVGEKLEMPLEQPDQDEYDPCKGDWAPLLDHHVQMWGSEGLAYAKQDVHLLRGLRRALGNPPGGDNDSTLACAIGSCRWRGWSIDRVAAEDAFTSCAVRESKVDTNPHVVLPTLRKLAGITRASVIEDTTDVTLAQVEEWGGDVGAYAADVRDSRSAGKEKDYIGKVLRAERAHWDFSAIGALTGRMAGRGGVSGHGCPTTLRHIFTLADAPFTLEGGDMDSFEVTIMAAVYNDPGLTEMLKSGKKIHALYGAKMLALDYDEVRNTEHIYKKQAKPGFLGKSYGAQHKKLAEVFGISEAVAKERDAQFENSFPGMLAEKLRVFEKFCSMRQPGGLGTRVEWHEPADFEETILGFKRYFTLENQISKALFDLSSSLPPEWTRLLGKVMRRKGREQTPGGAVQSALYGAAFQVQAKNLRAAGNHRIQGTGAEITKHVHCGVWAHQPVGVSDWVVQPYEIHDEVVTPTMIDLTSTVGEVVESYRKLIPLIKMLWKRALKNWAEKG